ncbi:protein of unknown function [Azospirillum baldaniorum]|uniref:Uncharacterized protein n=1 Tax=Azospirillum baldaniorum TaxID=1064539 RepID=A0A9P1JRL0_9PROT|nr:protein of unknown function [Azospirillum baldaniorum]
MRASDAQRLGNPSQSASRRASAGRQFCPARGHHRLLLQPVRDGGPWRHHPDPGGGRQLPAGTDHRTVQALPPPGRRPRLVGRQGGGDHRRTPPQRRAPHRVGAHRPPDRRTAAAAEHRRPGRGGTLHPAGHPGNPGRRAGAQHRPHQPDAPAAARHRADRSGRTADHRPRREAARLRRPVRRTVPAPDPGAQAAGARLGCQDRPEARGGLTDFSILFDIPFRLTYDNASARRSI